MLLTSEQNELIWYLHEPDLPHFLICSISIFFLNKTCNKKVSIVINGNWTIISDMVYRKNETLSTRNSNSPYPQKYRDSSYMTSSGGNEWSVLSNLGMFVFLVKVYCFFFLTRARGVKFLYFMLKLYVNDP